jgi:SAM-dependent methyltransferase
MSSAGHRAFVMRRWIVSAAQGFAHIDGLVSVSIARAAIRPLARRSLRTSTMSSYLDRLIASLPEVYQPIYGHPELSQRVSRTSEDRLRHIVEVYDALAQQLGRPLRVLDLGCAQGYFCLSLAARGAIAHGVDFQQSNVAVCEALAQEHPGLKATFETARVEDVLAALEPDRYDLVLGLSIFHHIIHQRGAASVQRMLAILADKVAAGVFELALASEPPAWAASQPANPRAILAGFGFVIELAQAATHLSAITRPLYFASSRYWRLNGRMERFTSWTSQSHGFEHGTNFGTRRYYFGAGMVAKLFQLDFVRTCHSNLRDHRQEIAFLSDPPAGFETPKLLLHGRSETEAWLVREHLEGALLIDLIAADAPYDAGRVLRDVAGELAALEAVGLHHNDVRTWNVLIAPDGRARLIDYGAISRDDKDCGWPGNLFLSFLIFAHETISGKVEDCYPFRTPKLNPDDLPEPYRSAFWRVFERPEGEWRFADLSESLIESLAQPPEAQATRRSGLTAALRAMEEACGLYRMATIEWRNRAAIAEQALQQAQGTAPSAAGPSAAE